MTRFRIKGEGAPRPTNTYLLKFDTPRVPEHIYIGPYRVRVDLFVPNPTRCFNCQSFGHGKATCREVERCVKCSRSGHSSFQCENDAHCANCDGDHMATSKDCPIFQKEKAIQKIKSEKSISYGDARRIYNTANSQSQTKTYASAVRSTASIGTQTSLSWPESDSNPKTIHVPASSKSVSQSSQTASTSSKTVDSNSRTTSSKSVDSSTKQHSSKTNDKTKIKSSSRSSSAGNRQTQPAASRHPSVGNRQTQSAANRQSPAGNRQKPNADKQHKSSDRQRKEERNAITMFNRFGNLDKEGQDDPFDEDDNFMEVSPPSPGRDRSKSPVVRRSQKKISPLPTSQ